jgi:hypothetical protein
VLSVKRSVNRLFVTQTVAVAISNTNASPRRNRQPIDSAGGRITAGGDDIFEVCESRDSVILAI